MTKDIIEGIDTIDNLYNYIFKKYATEDTTKIYIRYGADSMSVHNGMYGVGYYGVTIDAFLSGHDFFSALYASDSKKAIIYEIKKGKILYSDTYADYDKDINSLSTKYPDIVKYMSKSNEIRPFRKIMEAIARISSKNGISVSDIIILLGYDGIVDYYKSGSGALSTQCLVYSSDNIRQIESISIDTNKFVRQYTDIVIDGCYGYVAKKIQQLGSNTIS